MTEHSPKSRPRVALDCRALHWPGIGRYCTELAHALVSVAPDIEFLWLCNQASTQRLPQGPHARCVILNSRPLSIAEQFEVPRALRRHQVDLYHAPASHTLPVLAPRMVVTVHDYILKRYPEFMPNPLGRLYYRFMNNFAVQRARHIITVSDFTHQDIKHFWPHTNTKITTIHNGVSAIFQPPDSETEKARVRQALQLPEEYLLYVGTLKRHKNVPQMLSAYAGLSPELRARFPLVMVAKHDPRYPEVMTTAQHNGIENSLIWRPGIEERDLPALYHMARCLVLPSLYEGFGLPVLEAMACGTPSLISQASALPEVGGDACLLADPLDTKSLCQQMQKLLENDALHDELASRAIHRAQAFSWHKAATQTAAVYREALS